MRVKKITIFLLLIVYTFFFRGIAFAECDGTECGSCSGRCGTQTCTYSGTFTSYDNGCQICTYECWDQNSVSPSADTSYWVPEGYSSVTCVKDCKPSSCSAANNASCIYETATVVCNCEPDPTTTPAANPTGGGGTDPAPTPTPTPATYTITGNIQKDINAAVSGTSCIQSTSSPLELTGLTLQAQSGTNTYNGNFSTMIPSNYIISTSYTGVNYTVTLNLTNQVGLIEYVCSCPAATDPNNPYICSYSGIGAPNSNINFYLKQNNLSNVSWFQVFGGNLFGRNSIFSIVPYAFCSDANDCTAAVATAIPNSSNFYSSGFPISATENSSDIASYDRSSVAHSYFHPTSRTSNSNSYGISTDLNKMSYDYFYKLAENSIQEVGNGEDLEPLLSDWTNSAWWSNNDVNYIKVNGNVSIDESQGFNLNSNQKLIVFVDGNLTIDDSNTGDSNHKITSVAKGGFLAFIASGNILVTPNVGYELNPNSPSTPLVSEANSNVEGVFIADKNLIIQTKSATGEVPPDKKFIGSGTFVGWEDVKLNRTFNDNSLGPILNNTQAIENFIYRPDLLSNWPTKLKASISNWREIDPQLIEQ